MNDNLEPLLTLLRTRPSALLLSVELRVVIASPADHEAVAEFVGLDPWREKNTTHMLDLPEDAWELFAIMRGRGMEFELAPRLLFPAAKTVTPTACYVQALTTCNAPTGAAGDAGALKTTREERAKPNQPWYRKFQKKKALKRRQ